MRKTRNDRLFYYCLTDGERIPIVDGNGCETGEHIIVYASAVSMFANVSPATGIAQEETFGNLETYDKVIVTHDMTCPIDENTVLFIDKEPDYGDPITIATQEETQSEQNDVNQPNGEEAVEEEEASEEEGAEGDDSTTNPTVYTPPLYDYAVTRVAKSLNCISIAVKKVSTS